MTAEIQISNGDKIYEPIVEGEIVWQTERRSSPGKLTFNVISDNALKMTEGNAVKLIVDGSDMFFGFIFKLKRGSDRKTITVTAYDQLRYLKNKDGYTFIRKTAAQIIKLIADDYRLNIGTLANTKHVLPSRIEDDTALIDMIENALDEELKNTGTMYVMYDDCGKITLKSIADMHVGVVIDEQTAQELEYTSSIDDNTYNQVKLVYDNEEAGVRDVYLVKDGTHINEWGLLQYFEKLEEGEDGRAKAEALLELYNSKTRNLKINGAFGDARVRAGCLIIVMLDLGDVAVKNYMLVESCKHTISGKGHFMDLKLRGGEFIA